MKTQTYWNPDNGLIDWNSIYKIKWEIKAAFKSYINLILKVTVKSATKSDNNCWLKIKNKILLACFAEPPKEVISATKPENF